MDMETRYNRIKEEVGENEFDVDDLCNLLDIKRSTAYWVIRELRDRNLVVKPMRGRYRLSSSKIVNPPRDIEGIRKHLLKKITRRFSFTGLSVLESFIHHIPYVIIYHLFVEPGSSGDFKTEIGNISRMEVLIEPSMGEITLFLDKVDVKKLIIIRENNYFYSSKEGLSSKESAFIDLYFEVTRGRLPFIETDMEEIFRSLAMNNLVNYSRLMKYAKERGVKWEIKEFLQSISDSIEIPLGALE